MYRRQFKGLRERPERYCGTIQKQQFKSASMCTVASGNGIAQLSAPMWSEETFDPDVFPTMILNDERYAVKRPLTDEEYINFTHDFVSATSQSQSKVPFVPNSFGYQMRTPFADAHNTRLQDYSNFDMRAKHFTSYDVPHKPPPVYEVSIYTSLL